MLLVPPKTLLKSTAGCLTAYTDGSSTGKVGPGGWAFVVIDPNTNKELFRMSGRATNTTNNRMELSGPIAVLKVVPTDEKIIIVSDAQLVVKGYNEWLPKWKETDWHNDTIKNRDLWERLDKLVIEREAQTIFTWTRGHTGSSWNNIVDELAVQARKRGK